MRGREAGEVENNTLNCATLSLVNGHGESQIEGEDVRNLSCVNRGENVARSGTGEFGMATFCRGGQRGRSDGDDGATSNNGECLEFVKLLLVAPGDRFSIKGLVNFHVGGTGRVNLNFGANGWSTGGAQEGNDALELGGITEGEGVCGHGRSIDKGEVVDPVLRFFLLHWFVGVTATVHPRMVGAGSMISTIVTH